MVHWKQGGGAGRDRLSINPDRTDYEIRAKRVPDLISVRSQYPQSIFIVAVVGPVIIDIYHGVGIDHYCSAPSAESVMTVMPARSMVSMKTVVSARSMETRVPAKTTTVARASLDVVCIAVTDAQNG